MAERSTEETPFVRDLNIFLDHLYKMVKLLNYSPHTGEPFKRQVLEQLAQLRAAEETLLLNHFDMDRKNFNRAVEDYLAFILSAHPTEDPDA